MSLDHFFKLMGCHFETFQDCGAWDNPTVQVWRVAPEEVTAQRRARLTKNLGFGSPLPGGGPLGNLLQMVPLLRDNLLYRRCL
jgi:hypothetical protein